MKIDRRSYLVGYGIAAIAVATAFGISRVIPEIEPTPAILFLASVSVSAWYGGIGPGLLATVLSTLLLDYFFLPPIHSVDLGPAVYVSLAVFLLVAVLINSQQIMRQRLEWILRLQNRRKSEFMAVLAHELRNFLSPVVSALAVVRLGVKGDPSIEQSCMAAEHQVRNMSRLINDLLDVARINEGKLQLSIRPEDLGEIVLSATAAVRPMIEARGHRLEVSLPPAPLPLDADRTRLEQVLVNLLMNAAKYTPDGGRIRLTVEHEADELVVRVQDNGKGIEREVLPHVFALFTQGQDASEAGLGIGLSLVRALVEMHGGSIAAFSAGSGCGSEFVVQLPAARLPASLPAAIAANLPRQRAVTTSTRQH